MELALDELHSSVQQTARDFAQREVSPAAVEWDRQERMPESMAKRIGELGFWGIRIPERFGGAGLDITAYAIIVEELARQDGSLALNVAAHNGLASSHIANFGTDEQRARYLPKLATGEWLGAWALTEPGSGFGCGRQHADPSCAAG
jgi:alkylation response protein AidB-like acyl-CoA dehydrogenase